MEAFGLCCPDTTACSGQDFFPVFVESFLEAYCKTSGHLLCLASCKLRCRVDRPKGLGVFLTLPGTVAPWSPVSYLSPELHESPLHLVVQPRTGWFLGFLKVGKGLLRVLVRDPICFSDKGEAQASQGNHWAGGPSSHLEKAREVHRATTELLGLERGRPGAHSVRLKDTFWWEVFTLPLRRGEIPDGIGAQGREYTLLQERQTQSNCFCTS